MSIDEKISAYRSQQQDELINILAYWMQHTIDDEHGGFFGKIDDENSVSPHAPKGSVLNSRILWSFSAAFRHTGNSDYLEIADRAYQYIIKYFFDKDYGGVYWTVNYKGAPLDTKKQIYALAFCLYGISEYYLASGNENSKEIAIDLYKTIEKYSHDKADLGYTEALTRDWQEIADLRLSDKDANERKTMNTHLHVLEAYTNLYRIWPEEQLKENITELLELFLNKIIDNNHLVLFFDDVWNKKSTTVSYGHDIEAAWLLLEAAEVIQHSELITAFKIKSIELADGAMEGLDKDGGMFYEYHDNHLVREKHWWVQAEAMVGFFNSWELTGNELFLDHSIKAWEYTKNNLLHAKGEWIWGIGSDGLAMPGEDKAGLWKCPYHNSRACMEIIKRLTK